MKKLFFLIPILLVVACSEQAVYFSGSVGIYPDKIFWAYIEYPPPDLSVVENAKVTLDSVYHIPFNGEKNGYYKEPIVSLAYNSKHTVQVEVEDKENIYGTTEIPSSFSFDMEDKINAGDSLVIRWTHADSMETSPDQWRLLVLMGGDTLYHLGISSTVNEHKIFPGVLTENIEIIMDAIRFGDISGSYGNSVFAGLVRKRFNVTVNNDF